MPSRSNVRLISSGTSSQFCSVRSPALTKYRMLSKSISFEQRGVAPRRHRLGAEDVVRFEPEIAHPRRLVLHLGDALDDRAVQALVGLERVRVFGVVESVTIFFDQGVGRGGHGTPSVAVGPASVKIVQGFLLFLTRFPSGTWRRRDRFTEPMLPQRTAASKTSMSPSRVRWFTMQARRASRPSTRVVLSTAAPLSWTATASPRCGGRARPHRARGAALESRRR